MDTAKLREILTDFPKYKGTEIIKPSNLVNSGFPSCFNLSFGEGPMHELFGQYLDYDKNLIFSTIQSCIRHEDWEKIVSKDPECYRYLNLFDMAGVGGMTILLDGKNSEEVAKFHMKSELEFLKKIGLDIGKLKILYFTETPIEEATKGKYDIEKLFPTDPYYKYWVELGLKPEQLEANKTRDTMLALNVFGLPTPWGYRYEILYSYENKLWDIGTVEYLTYRPTFDETSKVIDIIPFNHCLGASVVGLERIATILNKKSNVWEVDTIYPLIELVKEKSEGKEESDAVVIIQAFRAIHKIIADGNIYSDLNTRRKEYIRGFYREFFERCKKLGIIYNQEFLTELIELNAKLNPWYPELLASKYIMAKEFGLREESFKNDRSIKHRGVAQQ